MSASECEGLKIRISACSVKSQIAGGIFIVTISSRIKKCKTEVTNRNLLSSCLKSTYFDFVYNKVLQRDILAIITISIQ